MNRIRNEDNTKTAFRRTCYEDRKGQNWLRIESCMRLALAAPDLLIILSDVVYISDV
jgi:hypothetical protein